MSLISTINTLGQQIDRELLLKALRDEAVLSFPSLLIQYLGTAALKRGSFKKVYKTRFKKVMWRLPNNKTYPIYIGRWKYLPGALPLRGTAERGVVLLPSKPLDRELELAILGHELGHIRQRTLIEGTKTLAGVTTNYLGRKLAKQLTRGHHPIV